MRTFRHFFIGLLLVTIVCGLFFPSHAFQKKAFETIEKTIFDQLDVYIEVSHLSFDFPFHIGFHDVLIKDREKNIVFAAKHANLTPEYTQLFKKDQPKLRLTIEHASLYSIPSTPLPSIHKPPTTCPILVTIGELEISKNLSHGITRPLPVEFYAIQLQNIVSNLSDKKIELFGEALLEGTLDGKALTVQSEWIVLQDRSLRASFKAFLDHTVPFNGNLHLSPTLAINGSSLKLPSTDIENIRDLASGLKGYQGSVEIEALFSGTLTDPLIELMLKSDLLTVNSMLELKHLLAHSICHLSSEQANGQASLSALINEKDVLVTTDFHWLFDHLLTFSHLQLQAPGTEFDASLSISPTELWIEGNAKGSFKNLSLFNQKNSLVLKEPLLYEIKIPRSDRESLQAMFSFSRLSIDELYVNEVALEIASENPIASSRLLNLQFYAKEVTYQDLKIANVNLTSSLNTALLAQNSFRINVEGIWKETPLTIDIDGFLQNPIDKPEITIHSATANALNLSMRFLEPFNLPLDQQAPLAGNLVIDGQMARFLQSLTTTPPPFSGQARALLNVGGTYQKPQFQGHLEILDGTYEIPEIGVSLRNFSSDIQMIGSHLYFNHLMASDGKAGKVSGSGHFALDKEHHHPFILELTLQEAAFFNQDYIQTSGNGSLTFKGNSQGGSIQGKLQVSSALMHLPERSSSTINTLEVTYVNIPKNKPQPQSLNPKQPIWPLTFDIKLTIPRSLKIEGRDLTSTWKGELAVQGSAQAPLWFGELQLIEGEYLFNGNPFTLNEGIITFAGDLDKKTTLYVIANKDLDKVKIDVIAKGVVKNPALSFRSNPPLPQREILSWILFNRGTAEISPFQGTQLSESITNLSMNPERPDILSKIRSALGIDRLEIGRNPNSDTNDVNVQVGKYISDDILISVIKSDVNRLAIEANLNDKIKLQAQVSDDSQGQLFIKWRRDY